MMWVACRATWSSCPPFRIRSTRIKEAQIVVHEGHDPDLLGDLFDPDLLSGEHMAEIDLSFTDANPATASDRGGSIVKWIFQLAQALIRPR
jgi:hypothetical protein